MNERSHLSVAVLATASTLGILGTCLLRQTPWGINFPLWILLVFLAGVVLKGKSLVLLSKDTVLLVVPILLFSFAFLWRDADNLKVANATAIFVAVGMLAVRAHKGKISLGGLADYPGRLIGAWFVFVADFVNLVMEDLDWKGNPQAAKWIGSLMRGMCLAAPLLLIFGALFASADEVFGKALRGAFTIDAGDATVNVSLFVVLAVVVGGLFRRLFLHKDSAEAQPVLTAKPAPTTGTIEVATVFLLLDFLFLAFGFFQFRYLFGGAAHVAHVDGLSYSTYARSGFFELSVAAALTLPVVLGGHAVLPVGSLKAKRMFSVLASIFVACVFVVLTSALLRMNLYVEAYGLTQLRVYTTSFMCWLGLTLAWLLHTVVRHRAQRFPFGAIVAGFAVILALDLANPDALIAQTNLDPRKTVDTGYVASLSVDAAPVIADQIRHLTADGQTKLRDQLESAWTAKSVSHDWRSLNLSRAQYFARYRSAIAGD